MTSLRAASIRCWRKPLRRCGQDWHLAALSLRAPLPGCGQGLHPDFEERRTDGPWQTLSAMWCITMFTPDKAVYHAEHLHLGIRDTPDSTAVS